MPGNQTLKCGPFLKCRFKKIRCSKKFKYKNCCKTRIVKNFTVLVSIHVYFKLFKFKTLLLNHILLFISLNIIYSMSTLVSEFFHDLCNHKTHFSTSHSADFFIIKRYFNYIILTNYLSK